MSRRDYLTKKRTPGQREDLKRLQGRWSTPTTSQGSRQITPGMPADFISRLAAIREGTTPAAMMKRYALPSEMTEYMGNKAGTAESWAKGTQALARPAQQARTSDIEYKEAEQNVGIAAAKEARTGLEHVQAMKKGQQELEMMELEREKAALMQPIDVGTAEESLRQQKALAPHEVTEAKTRAENVLPMTVAQGEGPISDLGKIQLLSQGEGGVGGMLMQNEMATREAQIVGTQTGLEQAMSEDGFLGQIGKTGSGGAWTDASVFALQNMLSIIQTTLNSQVSPESQQIILNNIRNHPGYMRIFEWQDASGMWSTEQAWGGPYDQIFHQKGYNQAAELAKQIVQLVESGSTGVPQGQ